MSSYSLHVLPLPSYSLHLLHFLTVGTQGPQPGAAGQEDGGVCHPDLTCGAGVCSGALRPSPSAIPVCQSVHPHHMHGGASHKCNPHARLQTCVSQGGRVLLLQCIQYPCAFIASCLEFKQDCSGVYRQKEGDQFCGHARLQAIGRRSIFGHARLQAKGRRTIFWACTPQIDLC